MSVVTSLILLLEDSIFEIFINVFEFTYEVVNVLLKYCENLFELISTSPLFITIFPEFGVKKLLVFETTIDESLTLSDISDLNKREISFDLLFSN